MSFVQIIEFETTRLDEFNDLVDEWLAATEGRRIATSGVLARDRDQAHTYLQIVEFPSYEEAMENSDREDTTHFAERVAKLCLAPPTFRNLDVIHVDDL
ncbi:MAG TPA: hypothetical protein VGR06_38010 [Actinophytocola sp.]|jgi:hypothetical protein|uniref:hypothetical protein n=1 Tax=Actinophytocola sp. TaxID=1872138 RepID=UPI002DFF81CA|nr:hypothetical protein [Actinophytocola sp.]